MPMGKQVGVRDGQPEDRSKNRPVPHDDPRSQQCCRVEEARVQGW